MADFLTDALQQEQADVIAKQKKLKEAYNRDSLGSYDAAQKHAYDTALPDDIALTPGFVGNPVVTSGLGKRVDVQFIQKIRSIAQAEYKNQQRKEIGQLTEAYGLNKPPDGPLGTMFDMPVRITDALGRDLGSSLGSAFNQVKNDFTNTTNGILGQNSSLMHGLNVASGVVGFAGAVGSDIGNIITQSPWIEKKLKAMQTPSKDPVPLKTANTFFSKLNTVWSNSTKKILGQLGQILDEWWNDPKTLCCFIKTLVAVALASGKAISGKSVSNSDFNNLVHKYMSGQTKISELVGTIDFFNKMISILKIIRNFLNQDLNFQFALNLDLGLSMSKASIGALMALLTALQQMLEDKIYTKMMDFVKKNTSDAVRACIPFEKLLRLLADWMSGPDGIFKYIETMVDAYMIGFQTGTQFGFDQSMHQKMMDVAALDKLINLLIKLRDSMANFELCIESDFINSTPDGDVTAPQQPTVGFRTDYGSLNNTVAGKNSSNGIVYPTDREVTAFLINRLGESPAFADQVITSAKTGFNMNTGVGAGSPNTNGGDPAASLMMAIGDCSRTLDSAKIEQLANLVADWEII